MERRKKKDNATNFQIHNKPREKPKQLTKQLTCHHCYRTDTYFTGHPNEVDNFCTAVSNNSSGTNVQLVVAVEMLSEGMWVSTLLIALTTPVSLNSMARPHNLITRHCCGEVISKPRGNNSISRSSKRKVTSCPVYHMPQRY